MVDVSEDTKKTVLHLWKTPTFPGAFGGLLAFQASLKHEKQITISLKSLRTILRDQPMYLMHIRNVYKFKRRSYSGVHGYGQLLQCDLAYIF